MSAPGRVADSLLRTLGGRTVLLHIASPAIAGDLGEQVGLAVPQFQDVPLGPAAFRRVLRGRGNTSAPATYELLVSAAAVEQLVGSLAFNSAALLFASAAAIVVDAVPYGIVSVVSAEAFGSPYLYRLGLRGAAAAVV